MLKIKKNKIVKVYLCNEVEFSKYFIHGIIKIK